MVTTSELAYHRANNNDFSAELRFDYVRVDLRKRSTNVSCDPAGYPTTLITISTRIGVGVSLFVSPDRKK